MPRFLQFLRLERICLGEKHYECKQCEKKTSHKLFQIHATTHTEEKGYKYEGSNSSEHMKELILERNLLRVKYVVNPSFLQIC